MKNDPPEQYGHHVIHHLVGQRPVVEAVRIALEATWNFQIPFPSMLFSGPPGLGKTEIARIISRELGATLHETLAQHLSTGPRLAGFLLGAADGDVVFIDEIQELDRQAQVQLYSALAEQRISVVGGPFGKTPQYFALPRFVLLAATTDLYRLNQPLRDRFEVLLAFSFYATDELHAILDRRVKQLQWVVQDGVTRMIAERSRGTPRAAIRLLSSCRRLAASVGERSITIDHCIAACGNEGVDELGLLQSDRQYLQRIKDGGCKTRLNVLAKQLGLPARTLTEVIEPYLVRMDLLDVSDGFRRITPKGMEHLAKQVLIVQETVKPS